MRRNYNQLLHDVNLRIGQDNLSRDRKLTNALSTAIFIYIIGRRSRVRAIYVRVSTEKQTIKKNSL